jgi:phosphoglycolate phosphatase
MRGPEASGPRARFRLVVFDLDGTLIDSRRDIADAANRLLVECGGTALPEACIGRMVGDGAATLVARAFEAVGVAPPPDALPRFVGIYSRHLTDHTRPYPGTGEVLASLSKQTKIALLTNKPLAPTLTILERLELARYFDASMVLGGDGPLPRKPDPAGLHQLIDSARVSPQETLLVGDSVIDWRTARAAAAAICVARYGFGFEGFPLESLEPSDLTIDSPGDLLRL